MIKKNYIFKNRVDTEIIFYDLLKTYEKIEKIKKKNDNNVVGVLFHE